MKLFTKILSYIVLVAGLVLSYIIGASLQLAAAGLNAKIDMPFNWIPFLAGVLITATLFALLQAASALLAYAEEATYAASNRPVSAHLTAAASAKPNGIDSTFKKCPSCGHVQPSARVTCDDCGCRFSGGQQQSSTQQKELRTEQSAAKDTEVQPIALGTEHWECPACGRVQRKGRMVCLQCGARFMQHKA